MVLKPEPTEVAIAGLKAGVYFEPKFVGILQQEIPGVRLQHFCIMVPHKTESGEERLENVTIGHWSRRDEEASIVTVTSERPATLAAVVKALNRFHEGAKK